MREKTGLLITPQFIGLVKTTEILIMDHERIVERSFQFELLNHNRPYRRLFELQNRKLIET